MHDDTETGGPGGESMSDIERDDIAQMGENLIVAATDGDIDTVTDILLVANERYGVDGIGALACVLAEACVKMTGVDQQTRRGAVAELCIYHDGRRITPEEAPPSLQPIMWAYRFIAAYANGGADEAVPLFLDDVDDKDKSLKQFIALVKVTGNYGRRERDKKRKDEWERRRNGRLGLN